MQSDEIRRRLEKALEVDKNNLPFYLNLRVKDEVLSIVAFNTDEEVQAQRRLLIDSLIELLQE